MFDRATYLILLLAWVAPVLAIQWHAGARILRARWRVVVGATLLSTVYLAAADRYALGAGIWQLSPGQVSGIVLFGLPLEELLFFLLTNLIVVQAVILFLAPELTPAFARAQWARHIRALRAALAPAKWRAGLLATGGAALAATLLAGLQGSAPALAAPAALLAGAPPGSPPPLPTLLGGAAIYLVLGTAVGWLARGNCLIARTITLMLGLGGYWWCAGWTAPLAAAVLACGPLLPALGLEHLGGAQARERVPSLRGRERLAPIPTFSQSEREQGCSTSPW